jgi:hypothetical protein
LICIKSFAAEKIVESITRRPHDSFEPPRA